jgi:methylmalonyl-CoA mutase cobalamin-binding domain/chain
MKWIFSMHQALSELMLQHIIKSDRTGAVHLTESAISEGIPCRELLDGVLLPALQTCGTLWEKREISLAQIFMSGKIAEAVFEECQDRQAEVSSLPPRGIIVLGNIEDDYHSLGRRIVISFMQAAGWRVHDLGEDVTAETFVEAALRHGAHVIGVSAMMHSTAMNILKVRELIDRRGLHDQLKLAVGGAVFNWRPELVEQVGADGTSASAAGADAECMRLQMATEKGAP